MSRKINNLRSLRAVAVDMLSIKNPAKRWLLSDIMFHPPVKLHVMLMSPDRDATEVFTNAIAISFRVPRDDSREFLQFILAQWRNCVLGVATK